MCILQVHVYNVSNLGSIVIVYRKDTMALMFENFSQSLLSTSLPDAQHWALAVEQDGAMQAEILKSHLPITRPI